MVSQNLISSQAYIFQISSERIGKLALWKQTIVLCRSQHQERGESSATTNRSVFLDESGGQPKGDAPGKGNYAEFYLRLDDGRLTRDTRA